MDTLQIKICSKIVKLGLYLDERQTLIEKIVTRDSVNPITPGEGGGQKLALLKLRSTSLIFLSLRSLEAAPEEDMHIK